jgi:hypothetical protein
MSAPAQKSVPLEPTTTARSVASAAKRAEDGGKRRHMAKSSAFFFSGRSRDNRDAVIVQVRRTQVLPAS